MIADHDYPGCKYRHACSTEERTMNRAAGPYLYEMDLLTPLSLFGTGEVSILRGMRGREPRSWQFCYGTWNFTPDHDHTDISDLLLIL